MNKNRDQVLAWIGLSEGGYVNHPKDPGGATDRGITQATYNAWNKMKGRPPKAVRGITKAEAEDIIFYQYMQPIRFDDLPSGLDYAVADFSVNSGPSRAVKELQAVVGVTQDGIMGAQTLAAVSSRKTREVIAAYCARRMSFLRRLKTWATFGNGWSLRVEGRDKGYQVGDIGVLDRAIRLAAGAVSIPQPGPVGTAKASGPVSFWAWLWRLFGG